MNLLSHVATPEIPEYAGPHPEKYWINHSLGILAAQQLVANDTPESPVIGYLLQSEAQQSSLRAAVEHLAFVSNTDPLTGLKNRNGLDLAFTELSQNASPSNKRSRVVSPEPTYLFHIDVDEFSEVNNSLGHQAGDKLLCSIAKLLLENTRADDIVARRGGDEFVVLVPSMPEELALGAALAMIGDVKETTGTSLSIGVTRVDFNESLDDNVHYADIALYEAKKERNSVVCYVPPLTTPGY